MRLFTVIAIFRKRDAVVSFEKSGGPNRQLESSVPRLPFLVNSPRLPVFSLPVIGTSSSQRGDASRDVDDPD